MRWCRPGDSGGNLIGARLGGGLSRNPKTNLASFQSFNLSLVERLFECFTITHRHVYILKRNARKRATTSTVFTVLASRSLPPPSSPPTLPAPTDRFSGQGHQITFEKSKSCYNITHSSIPVLLEGYNIQCWHTCHRPTQGCSSPRQQPHKKQHTGGEFYIICSPSTRD